MAKTPIYLGSILLEPNRWKAGKEPSFRLSEWIPRIREAGFDGIELWENHYLKADEREQAALRALAGYFTVFNTYAGFDTEERMRKEREIAASAIRTLKSEAVKFNVGAKAERQANYLRVTKEWAGTLPASVRLLCECHGGTVLETPEGAARAFTEWPETARYQVIVHAFSTPPKVLAEWMTRLGPHVTHVHVQVRDANDGLLRLDRRPKEIKEALRILKDHGFSGSFTLEFTEGTSTPTDRPDALFANALLDLAYLREQWS